MPNVQHRSLLTVWLRKALCNHNALKPRPILGDGTAGSTGNSRGRLHKTFIPLAMHPPRAVFGILLLYTTLNYFWEICFRPGCIGYKSDCPVRCHGNPPQFGHIFVSTTMATTCFIWAFQTLIRYIPSPMPAWPARSYPARIFTIKLTSKDVWSEGLTLDRL